MKIQNGHQEGLQRAAKVQELCGSRCIVEQDEDQRA